MCIRDSPEAYQREEGDLYQFNPSGIVVYLMKGIQELVTKVETLEQENIALRARVTNLEGN